MKPNTAFCPNGARVSFVPKALLCLLLALAFALAPMLAGLPAHAVSRACAEASAGSTEARASAKASAAASPASSRVKVAVSGAGVERWFLENYPELTCMNVYDGNPISTSDALNLLQGDNPVDMLYVRSTDCDIYAILSSGLLEDLSANAFLRERAESMHEPLRRLVTTDDGALVGSLGVTGWPMCRIPASWEAAGLTDTDAPQSFLELLDFAERWIERVEAGRVGNVRLHTLAGWGVASDDTRYTLWLMDLLLDCWAMRQQADEEPFVFDTPEFVELAERSREIGRTLVRAEKKPDKGSLSLYDAGLGMQMGYDDACLYSNAFPMRISSDEPVRIKASGGLFVVRRGSPHARACMEYIASVYDDDSETHCNPALSCDVPFGQVVPPSGRWDGYVFTEEWKEAYRSEWLFFATEPFATATAGSQEEMLLRQFAKGEISGEMLAEGLDEPREGD